MSEILDSDMPTVTVDQDYQAPSIVPLLPGERIYSVEDIPAVQFERREISDDELGAAAYSMIEELAGGKELPGPIVASLPSEDHRHDPRFRKYMAMFGRDSLIASSNIARVENRSDSRPELLVHTLLQLAHAQGTQYNREREEEPGRIPHEIRDAKDDEMAKELTHNRGWAWPYYGSVDATPLFVKGVKTACERAPEGYNVLGTTYEGKDGSRHRLIDAFDQAVHWIGRRMDANPEGLVEYKPAFPGSLENQTWRDSWDSYSHSDGSLANTDQGVASFDVQLLAMEALYDAADIYERLGADQPGLGRLRERADRLKQTIMDVFWVDRDGGFFAVGTDRDMYGNIRQLDICTSDMGHALNSRLLDGNDPLVVERREAIVRRLFSPDMLSQNGIRTLSNRERRFRAGSYHNGSVWPHDNYAIAKGLDRHNMNHLAGILDNLVLEGVKETQRFAEFFRGDPDSAQPYQFNRQRIVLEDEQKRQNVVELPSQDNMAWVAAAVYDICCRNRNLQYHTAQPIEWAVLSGMLHRSTNLDRQISKLLPQLLVPAA